MSHNIYSAIADISNAYSSSPEWRSAFDRENHANAKNFVRLDLHCEGRDWAWRVLSDAANIKQVQDMAKEAKSDLSLEQEMVIESTLRELANDQADGVAIDYEGDDLYGCLEEMATVFARYFTDGSLPDPHKD